MEELRMLIEMVAKLPTMAIWVLLGIFAYKVAIVGSIYGLARFAIAKLHDYLTRKKVEPPKVQEVLIDGKLNGFTITGCVAELCNQVQRARGKGQRIQSNYIHEDGVRWLQQAIDDKEAKDAAEGKAWGVQPEPKREPVDLLRAMQSSSVSALQQANALQNQRPYSY